MATRIKKESEVVHQKTRVLLTIENGTVIDSRLIPDNELIGSMDVFFHLAKLAGYQVTVPEESKE
jgi:hypothetical protein